VRVAESPCHGSATTDRLRALLKVIQARIRDNFGGSALALIQWVDKTYSDTKRQACPGLLRSCMRSPGSKRSQDRPGRTRPVS
jgi:hypothetical protein